DFRKTVFWEGALTTDEKGEAEIRYHNPDQASAYRISIEGTDGRGAWTHEEKVYHTELPFAMKVISPNWLSVGDQLMLPVQFLNSTDEPINGNLNTSLPTGLEFLDVREAAQAINLAPQSAKTIYLTIKVTDIPSTSLQINFAANAYQEKRDLKLSVRRQGFPFEISMAGNQAEDEMQFMLKDVVPGTVEASFAVFTDVYSELVNGSESILREPHGCFEQVSSSLYPNVLVLMLLQLSGKIKPAIKQKALKFIKNGYRKIKGYEIVGGGFDLYGRPAAKMGLSAYGLMELNDMQKVFPEVSKSLIARTRNYLLQMRDGNGGFKDGAKTGYYGRSDQKVRNAYTVHALIEAGEKDLDKELARVRAHAVKTQNPYLLALACRSYYLLDDQANGDELLTQLLALQQTDGAWPSKNKEEFHSVTRSRGMNYQIETAAFAVLAMLESPNPKSNHIESALSFIYGQRRGVGYFGSTQGTVLSLKAISAYLQSVQLSEEEAEAMLALKIDQTPVLSSTVKYGQA
ncbi:MAG: alpha-2-macroglobulin family protein, partial [Bacteroidota bacterium]